MTMVIAKEKLKELLVDNGVVEGKDFDRVSAEAEKIADDLDSILVDKNIIPDEYMGQIIAGELGVPFAQLESKKIPDHVLRVIPERVARKKHAIAFGMSEREGLQLAMRDPDDLEFIRLVEKKVGVKVTAYFATGRGIRTGIERYSRDLESAIRALVLEKGEDAPEAKKGKAGRADEEENDGRVVRVVELVMNYGYQNNASDIHIEPREKALVVRYRIDGILHDVVTLPRSILDALVTRIKILTKLRTDEHFAAQDGKFQEIIDGERIDVRVSVLPVVDGEKVVMRLLTEKGKRFNLEDIGLSQRDARTIRRHAKRSHGMILATGPTGSGKTTTMYAVLKELNTRDVNIATIEDPIEYAMEGVNQIQVNKKTGLTFAAGLRSIVRQDPDIIMVGEIRDEETAGIAVNAAMTGHLVLSTLHTNDAATTLPRFRDMDIEPFLIASSLNVIVAQRLVRKICDRCIMSFRAPVDDLTDRLPKKVIVEHLRGGTRNGAVNLYKGKGCDRCGDTGYRGRVGVFEVLEIDDEIRELIMSGANAKVISRKAVENGMTTMFEDGLRKVVAGVTTLDEVLRVTGGE